MNKNYAVKFIAKNNVILQSKDIPVPAANELLIKTRMTAISTGTELTVLEEKYSGEKTSWAEFGKFPFSPGYNNIGIVKAAASKENDEWIGKRVATYGCHGMYITADARDIRPVPDEVSDEEAAFFTFAEIAMNGTRRGRLQWGDVAIVYGAGLIGQMIVRFCQYAGARYIFSVDISDKRLSFLPSDSKRIIPVNPKTQDLKKLVSDKTAGRMADIVYEATGNHDLIAEEFDALRVEGRMVIVSSPAKSTLFNFQQLCSRNSYTIIGAHNRSHTPVQTWENPWTQKHDGEFFFELIKNGDIIVRPLVTHRVPYTQAIEMYQMLMSDRSEAMGVLLDWENTEIY